MSPKRVGSSPLKAVADASPLNFYLWFDPADIHDPRLTGWEYRMENATDYSADELDVVALARLHRSVTSRAP